MTKLKLAHEMNEDVRVKCLINNWLAVDENCGTLDRESKPIHLTKSNGRRKSGRPSKYFLFGTGLINAPVIQSYSDEEAVILANEILESLPLATPKERRDEQ